MVPGTLGPTIDEVYLIISVSGGRRTPPSIELGSLKILEGKPTLLTVLAHDTADVTAPLSEPLTIFIGLLKMPDVEDDCIGIFPSELLLMLTLFPLFFSFSSCFMLYVMSFKPAEADVEEDEDEDPLDDLFSCWYLAPPAEWMVRPRAEFFGDFPALGPGLELTLSDGDDEERCCCC